MARIRTIKPEFPQSESIGRLSRDARLLFIQLWTVSDDEGRLRGASRMLASLLYPYDDDARELIDGWIDELEREQCIKRYSVDGAQYIVILNWLTHQKIDKPSKSRLPAPPDNSRNLAKPRETSPADLGPGPSTSTEDLLCTAVADAPAAHENEFEEFWKEYPKRSGANPKVPAERRFRAAIERGVSSEMLVASVKTYASELRSQGKIGTEFVAQAETWLREQRWADYAPRADLAEHERKIDEDMRLRGYEWTAGRWVKCAAVA